MDGPTENAGHRLRARCGKERVRNTPELAVRAPLGQVGLHAFSRYRERVVVPPDGAAILGGTAEKFPSPAAYAAGDFFVPGPFFGAGQILIGPPS